MPWRSKDVLYVVARDGGCCQSNGGNGGGVDPSTKQTTLRGTLQDLQRRNHDDSMASSTGESSDRERD